MSVVKIQGNASGTGIFTVAAPATNTDRTLTLPDQTGTVLTNAGPFTANASASNGAVTIDALNNVGIGTSTPQNDSGYGGLTVNGANGSVITLRGNNTNAGRIYTTAPDNLNIDSNGSASGTILFRTGTGSTERARIDTSGNLLVGTTSTTNSARLSVNGVVYMNNTIYAPGVYSLTTAAAANMHVASDGTLYRSTSSLKYKKDVQDAVHGLAEVMSLRSVTYKGKSEADGDTVFGGLIAEEVHAAGLTEFVQYAEDGTPDALAYGNMVSLCIKAIQEQQVIIDAQQAALNQLTTRIAALEAR